MSIKMDRALYDEFTRVARDRDRPAAQLVRELMRDFISRTHKARKRGSREPYAAHEPNAETIRAIEELDNGGGQRFDTVDDLFRDLGIPIPRMVHG